MAERTVNHHVLFLLNYIDKCFWVCFLLIVPDVKADD